MSRSLLFVAGGIMLLTALAVVAVTIALPEPKTHAEEISSSLEQLSSDTASDIDSFRTDVHVLSDDLRQARAVVLSVANERTPTPATNAFTNQWVNVVSNADARREERLRPIEQKMGSLSQQLIDLQQRATSIEIRIQDAIRDLGGRISEAINAGREKPVTLEVTIALIGIFTSLITLGLAVNKEARESAETKLKIRELEQKLAQSGSAGNAQVGT